MKLTGFVQKKRKQETGDDPLDEIWGGGLFKNSRGSPFSKGSTATASTDDAEAAEESKKKTRKRALHKSTAQHSPFSWRCACLSPVFVRRVAFELSILFVLWCCVLCVRFGVTLSCTPAFCVSASSIWLEIRSVVEQRPAEDEEMTAVRAMEIMQESKRVAFEASQLLDQLKEPNLIMTVKVQSARNLVSRKCASRPAW